MANKKVTNKSVNDGRNVKHTPASRHYESSSTAKITKTGGSGKIKQSTVRYDPDEADREKLGLKSLELFVDKVPKKCSDCIFYVHNVNYDKVSSGHEHVFYCLLRALLASAQFGGINIATPKTYKCPLKPIQKSKKFIELRNNHLERIKALEQEVFGHDNGDDEALTEDHDH